MCCIYWPKACFFLLDISSDNRRCAPPSPCPTNFAFPSRELRVKLICVCVCAFHHPWIQVLALVLLSYVIFLGLNFLIWGNYIKLSYQSWSTDSQVFCESQMKLCREKYFRKCYPSTLLLSSFFLKNCYLKKYDLHNIIFSVASLAARKQREDAKIVTGFISISYAVR